MKPFFRTFFSLVLLALAPVLAGAQVTVRMSDDPVDVARWIETRFGKGQIPLVRLRGKALFGTVAALELFVDEARKRRSRSYRVSLRLHRPLDRPESGMPRERLSVVPCRRVGTELHADR